MKHPQAAEQRETADESAFPALREKG